MVLITIYAEQSTLKDLVDHCLLFDKIEILIIRLGIATKKKEILIQVAPTYYSQVDNEKSALVTILLPPEQKVADHLNYFCGLILKIMQSFFEEHGIPQFKVHAMIRSLADGHAESHY